MRKVIATGTMLVLLLFATVASAFPTAKQTPRTSPLSPLARKQGTPQPIWTGPSATPTPPSISPIIIGGSTAPPVAWPYITAIVIQKSTGTYICTGERVAALWVLTAQHCVYDSNTSSIVSPGNIAIGLGDASVSARTDWELAQQVVPYPTYNPSTSLGDAALLQIPASAPSTQSVSVASASDEPALPAPVWIAGWGLQSDGGTHADVAQQAQTIRWTQSYCASAWPSSFDSASELCAGGPDGLGSTYASPCGGDSGGPLVLSSNLPWNDELLGIADYVSASGCQVLPAVYQRVSFYYPWIVQSTGLAPVAINSASQSSATLTTATVKAWLPANEANATVELLNPTNGVTASTQVVGDWHPGYVTLTATGLAPGTRYAGYSVLTQSHYGNSTFPGITLQTSLSADLRARITCPTRLRVRHSYACKLIVTNAGPTSAQGVRLYLTARPAHTALKCAYGLIPAHVSKVCMARVRPTRAGRYTFTLKVSSTTSDPNSRNNAASVATHTTR